ncbi:hypothetical protein ACFV2H_45395 [Streptomyces sp. NPDC059629]|uniref:MmyB family transcriptional regulator n=1 Tax=Streptomyces sp. NPDC059629 TaxID=3346889 RepID=UPI003683ED57
MPSQRTNRPTGYGTTSSEPIARWWRDHDVRLHWSGVKEYEHPAVGRLILPFETLTLPDGRI